MQQQDAEQRWAAAATLAASLPDDELPQRRRRTLAALGLLLVGLLALPVVLWLLLPPVAGEEVATSSGRLAARVVLVVLALVVMMGGWVWAGRTGRWIPRWRHVAAPLSRGERRDAMRQLRGAAPTDPRRTSVLTGMAREQRRVLEGQVPHLAAMLLLLLGSLLGLPGSWATRILLVAVPCLVLGAVHGVVTYRRAGHFLEARD